MKAIFQILYYQVVYGRKNTPLHVLSISYVILSICPYKCCRNRELLTAFNKQGCGVSHKTENYEIRYIKIHHFKKQR